MLRIMLATSLLAEPLVAAGAAGSIAALQANQKSSTDTSCRQLKRGVKPRDLVAFRSEVLKSVAAGMLDESYDRAYRAASYSAYPSPRELGRTLKLGEGFSLYENITGTRGKGVELIRNYDAMLKSHYALMGLVKYKKVPRNRILARVNFHYYMFRDEDGVAYFGDRGVMRLVADPSVVIRGDPCWGFCHETGHVLQMIPQMTWGA